MGWDGLGWECGAVGIDIGVVLMLCGLVLVLVWC